VRSRQTEPLQAAILAGGLGTRLRSVVGACPKVLAPVGNRPYVSYVLDQLAAAAVAEVILLTGHQADRVSATLGKTYRGMRLVYSAEPLPLGTGGSLRAAVPYLSAPTVLLLNGDSYCAVNLDDLRAFHVNESAGVSLVLTKVSDRTRYGTVDLASDGRVLHFAEKQRVAGPGWISAGIYLLKRSLIEEIPPARPLSLERDLLPAWLGRGVHIYGYRCRGRFIDIGTPASYAAAEAFFSEAS
jgi:NDP-sugar pyrophosphorylase family protein